jgi:translation initiation factor IF-2
VVKKRVFELAKDLGLSSKEVLAHLRDLGVDIKGHMSSLEPETVEILVDAFKPGGARKGKKEPKTQPQAAAAAPAKGKAATTPLPPPVTPKAPTAPKVKAAPKVPVAAKAPEAAKPPEAPKTAPVAVEAPPSKPQEEPLVEPQEELLVKLKEEPQEKPKEGKEEKKPVTTVKPVIQFGESVVVKELAERLDKSPSEIIKKLMKLGIMATINQTINFEAAKVVANKLGFDVEPAPLIEEELIPVGADDPSLLELRPPVVTIMGHVDHGKTSLLDAIRHTNVMAKEFGGITQHIGAYKVKLDHGEVVFLDTPGHEAFTAMRARGAHVTDVVVLVVAADDGVMPQTIEAVNHAQAGNVPILVAVNKIDKPGADPNRVKQQLSEYGLIPEEWSGQTIFVEVSAKKRIGLEHLLEMLLLQSEILELKANPRRMAQGVVIEAELDKGKGPVATVLIQQGTLHIGDPFVVGSHYGKVRAMISDKGKKLIEAGPSTPVKVLGISGVPLAGDNFTVIADERKARQISLLRQQKQKEQAMGVPHRLTLDEIYQKIKEGEVKELKIILKGDVQGSVEALKESLEKLGTSEVRIKVIHCSVGNVTESDVMLASASNAIIIGFNLRPEPKVAKMAEQEGIDLRLYTVIYECMDEVKAALAGMLKPRLEERTLGRVEVREVFSVPKMGKIAGCYVQQGKMARDSLVRLLRDGKIIYQGRIGSLRRFKDDVREVQEGFECGVGLVDYQDVQVGDILEVYFIEEIAAKL